jgi:hypothetical protein
MAGSEVAQRIVRPKDALFEDCQLRFINFSGAEKQFNKEGDRNFALLLNEQQAAAMKRDGYNVKYLTAREEDEADQAYVRVKVSYKSPPGPKVVQITSKGRAELDESLVGMLDYVQFDTVDIIITPYVYNVNGNTGITAYLKTAYITIVEDILDRKYEDVPIWALEPGDDRLAITDGEDDELVAEWSENDE